MNFREHPAIRIIGYRLRSLKLKIKGLYYRGNRLYCPLCNHFYRKFLPGGQDYPVLTEFKVIGAGRRPNMVCPGCHSTDRDRLLHTFLCNTSSLNFPEGRLLHIAPEPALYSWIKAQYQTHPNDYIAGVKYHEGFYYDQKINLIDLTNLPFENESFELVMANHVLEHITDERKALSEIHRVLKPGGKAILQVPWSPLLEKTIEETEPLSAEERAKRFGQHDHVRLYGSDYPGRLEEAGFEAEILAPSSFISDENYMGVIAINPSELVFLAKKQTKQ